MSNGARVQTIAGFAIIVALASVAALAVWLLGQHSPSVPANVHIVQSSSTGEQWIRWDDNSDDEAGFRGVVRLQQDGAVIALSMINPPAPGQSQSPAPAFGLPELGEGCFDAVISVEAVTATGGLRPAVDAPGTVCIDSEGRNVYQPSLAVPEALRFPEPVPGDLRASIEKIGTGSYRLVFEGAANAKTIMVTSRTYDGAGLLVDERELPVVSGRARSIDLVDDEGLPPGCYVREYVVWSIDDGVLRGWSSIRQPLCMEGGRATFPDIDNPNAPPPAPAADVHVSGHADDAWRIGWQDRSTDETAFKVLVSVWNQAGSEFVMQSSAAAAANRTRVPFPAEVLSLSVGCYRVTIYVFAERHNTANGLPGNVTVIMCLAEGGARFEPAA